MNTIGERLQRAAAAFPDPATAWIDVLLLLETATARSRVQLLAALRDPAESIPAEDWARFEGWARQREQGTPVAYLVGRKEFWGLDFVVDPRVLIPRPDTETLVEAAVECIVAQPRDADGPVRVLDCCTGSGCVGIAVANELRARGIDCDLTLSDVSAEALAVAQLNAARLLPVPTRTVQSDLLQRIKGRFELITANPPYLTATETAAALAHGWGEPEIALRAADRGLAVLFRLSAEALGHLTPNGYLLAECADNQSEEVAAQMRAVGFASTAFRYDLAGRRRVVVGNVEHREQ